MVGTGTAYSWTIKQDHNLLLDGCSMVDRAHYDYHLKASSGAIDAGRDPGFSGYHFNLTPTRSYVHPASEEARVLKGSIDGGAFEYYGG